MLPIEIVKWVNLGVVTAIHLWKSLTEQFPGAGLLTDEQVIELASGSAQKVKDTAVAMQSDV